jgi:phage/plasmid-like protein (TIGR03299 family)
MTHEIDFSKGRANLAFTGETPWHGLGVNIDKNSSVDQWRVAAGLDWEAVKTKAQYVVNGEVVPSESEIIYRNDTNAQLGVVTERYKPVQPAEVLEFFRDLVGVNGWGLDVVGALDGGKKVWALAKTENEFRVKGTVDKVGMYLMLATSFDGSLATIAKFSSIRVVCNNTLTATLKDGLQAIKIGHAGTFNASKVKQQLGLIDLATNQLEENANILANHKLSRGEAVKFLVKIMTGEDKPVEELSTKGANIIKGVFDLYNGAGKGSTLATAENTAWGLLNAVTEHVDHHTGRNSNNRLRGAWFGAGEDLKNNALQLLLKAA